MPYKVRPQDQPMGVSWEMESWTSSTFNIFMQISIPERQHHYTETDSEIKI